MRLRLYWLTEFLSKLCSIRKFGYGQDDCAIIPSYEEHAVKIAPASVKGTVLRKGKCAMLLLGDFAEGGEFSADISGLAFKTPVAFDVENGQIVGHGQRITTTIPKHEYRLLLIADSEEEAEKALDMMQ